MPTRDSDKRPKGLRALSALKANGFKSLRKESSEPPSPQDDDVDVPDYITADSFPSIPGDNKQLPAPPPLPLNNVQRREVPSGTNPRKESLNAVPRNGIGMDAMALGMSDGPMDAIGRANGPGNRGVPPPTGAVLDGDYDDEPVDNRMPMNGNGMPMSGARMPMPMRMNSAPRPEPPTQSPSPRSPYDVQPPVRSPPPNEVPRNHVTRSSIEASTVPYSPKPVRPPSIPIVERVPSDDATLKRGDNDIESPPESTINTNIPPTPSDNEPTPTTSRENAPWNGPGALRTPPPPGPEYEPVAAPLNPMHYGCYQEHRSMPPAQNLWYPLPCMTCQKYDREVRHRCVFCCLRVCVGCYQSLQKCQRRSLNQLMESIQA